MENNPFKTSFLGRIFPAGMRKRWWMFRLFDVIAQRWPVFKPKKGLLVIRMDGIGDMVLFRSSLEHYSQAFDVDKADITVVGCESWSSLAGQVFEGYNVISINEHRYAKRPFYRFRISLKIRKLSAKIAVGDSFLRRALMTDSLVLVSGAERKAVCLPYINEPTKAEYTWYLSQFTDVIDTGPYPTHEIIRHHRFVSEISGKDCKPVTPAITWPDTPATIPEPYAILNPGSNEYGRRWPLESYFELARELVKIGYKVMFVGKADEKKTADALDTIAREDGIIDMTGKTNLNGLLDLLKNAKLVVSNDTGPAHLSIALGAPTVVIVGGGHFTSFVPYPPEQTPEQVRFVHEEMDCYHCFWRCDKRQNPKDSFPCVEAVPLQTVLEACQEITSGHS
ncbi:MAG: glycosyltransferase family 9 protein [Rhodospirillales bacterium]|nr:glycosyltransferase family 9 protein [Rhodospirillales bacterium]